MKKTNLRQRTVAVALASVTAMSLSACGGAEPEEAEATGPITLRASWWGGESRNEATLAAFELYESMNPNVTIQSEYLPFDGYFQKLATTTAAGDAPDLMAMQYSYFPEYVTRGALGILEGIDVEALDPAAVPQGVFDGERYAVTAGANTQTVAYNPEAFSKAGVDVPQDDWTWDDYFALCEAIVASGTVQYCSNDISGRDTDFDFWMSQQGKSFYTADGDLGFTAKDLTEFWSLWADLRKNSIVPPADVTAEVTGDPATYPSVRGLTAIELTYSGTTLALSNAAGYQLEMLPYPSGGAGSESAQYLVGTGIMWSSPPTSEHPEAVADLINFLLTDPAAIALLGVQRGVPFSQAARDSLVDLSPGDQAAVDFVSKVAGGDLAEESVFYNAPPASASQLTKLFSETSQQVSYERMSPADAAAQFIEAAKPILSAGN